MRICSRAKTLSQRLEAAVHSGALLLLWLTATSAMQAQDFTYTNNNGTITITGYTGPGGNVTIPNAIDGLPVTSIGASAFSYSSITSVTIPNSVTSIGDGAFNQCLHLTNATLGSGVTNIGASSFGFCIDLTGVTIPNSVTSIGAFAFQFCSGLTNVTLGSGATSIPDYAFVACSSLINITIPNRVTNIGNYAFSECPSLANVTLGIGATTVGYGAFNSCSRLTDIAIPNSVTSISDYAFELSTNLTSLHFEGNAPSVGGRYVFLGDKATIYYLPGTTGWGSTFAGLPTAVWTLPFPLILTSNPSFGVRTNQFGFTVSWATNLNVVVEAASDLANPIWFPLQTNAFKSGWFYFTDPQWTNYPMRFYRIRSP
jgi:hypothetical protein